MRTLPGLKFLLALSFALGSTVASAHRPLPGQAGHYGPMLAPYTQAPPTVSGTWTRLTGSSEFPGVSPDTSLLMTDGTVLMHDACTPYWYRLTPDATESYVHGSWNLMSDGDYPYAPLYFASAVLNDGRMIVNGGEYVYDYGTNKCAAVWTTAGALYDPVANSWTSVPAPPGWSTIGDAASVVLQNGTYMLQNCCNEQAALATISGTEVGWTATGSGKADSNDEEGWTLVNNGDVLTVDANSYLDQDTAAESYWPAHGSWSYTQQIPTILVDPSAHEIGPAVLLPTNKVFQAGANPCGPEACRSHTAIYTVAGSGWAAGPDFPEISGYYMDSADWPAAILPDGNVLVQASPSWQCLDNQGNPTAYCSPSHFFEYNGSKLVRVNEPADAPNIPSYEGRMLVLPSGNILWSSQRGQAHDLEVYSPTGHANSSWLPTVTSISATTLVRGTTGYQVTGTQFQGVSDGAAYGDDAQMATNFPLVRIKNKATGHYCFARTHGFSATQTSFDVPPVTPPVWQQPCGTGASQLQVVVQGLLSKSVNVTVH